jgi:hypothetical protein
MVKSSTSLIMVLLLSTGTALLAACTPPDSTEPTESTTTGGEIVTLQVGPETVDCVGVAPQQCLLVRESTETDYTYFYDTIVGFEYEPGYNYELLVEKTPVDNPPADSSSIRWTLVEVVEQVPVSP